MSLLQLHLLRGVVVLPLLLLLAVAGAIAPVPSNAVAHAHARATTRVVVADDGVVVLVERAAP